MAKSRKVVVICGAGASAALGADSRPMPLMGDLNDIVHDELEENEAGLAAALNLRRGMGGVEFETALGEVFAFRDSFDRTKAHRNLFLETLTGTRSQDRRARQQLEAQMPRAEKRLRGSEIVLRDVFYAEFGGRRVDKRASATAWTMLVNALGVDPHQVLVATTNYDPSATRAFEALDYSVDRGFRGGASEPPVLAPEGNLSTWRSDVIVVIHLHGAVGWYRTDADRIEDHGADHPKPIAQLGPPALLYPEPNKDPDRAIVKGLWTEFDSALEKASHVLVIGQSLEDDHLAARLRPHAGKLAVMRHSTGRDRDSVERSTRKRIVGASVIWGEFGDRSFIENTDSFEAWWGSSSGIPEPATRVEQHDAAVSDDAS